MKGTPKELEKCLIEINYFHEKECMEYLTNGHCLIKVFTLSRNILNNDYWLDILSILFPNRFA